MHESLIYDSSKNGSRNNTVPAELNKLLFGTRFMQEIGVVEVKQNF